MKFSFQRKLAIRHKLLLYFIPLGLIALVGTSIFSWQVVKKAVGERTLAQLTSVNILKKIQIEEYLKNRSFKDQFRVDERIQSILIERTGMGKTGESYLVNSASLLISESRFLGPDFIGKIKIETQATEKGLKGSFGLGIYPDYRNVLVYSVYNPIGPKNEWVLISEIDEEEAMLPAQKFHYAIITILFLVAAGWTFAIYLISNQLSGRIVSLKGLIEKLSKGNLKLEVPKTVSSDEIDLITQSISTLIDGLKSTSEFAQKIGLGDFKASYQPLGPEDALGNAILKMRHDLLELTEKETILLRQKTFALLEGEEKERKRIAMDLHDGLGQLLTALRFKMDTIEAIPLDLRNLLEECIVEVKRISQNLMPSVLVDFGLEAALNQLASNTARLAGIEVVVDYFKTEEAKTLSFELSTSIYRIVQEALNNGIKHAQANKINIQVEKDSEAIRLRILDDGEGFLATTEQQKGKGIENMRERTTILNGSFELISVLNKGTEIRIMLPLNKGIA